MITAWLLGCALVAAAEPPSVPATAAKPDLAAYEAAKAKAGRDANAQVKLALWCESHGLSAQRIKHLALATLSDPTNAAARGSLGLVLYQGKMTPSHLVELYGSGQAKLPAELLGGHLHRRESLVADGQHDLAHRFLRGGNPPLQGSGGAAPPEAATRSRDCYFSGFHSFRIMAWPTGS